MFLLLKFYKNVIIDELDEQTWLLTYIICIIHFGVQVLLIYYFLSDCKVMVHLKTLPHLIPSHGRKQLPNKKIWKYTIQESVDSLILHAKVLANLIIFGFFQKVILTMNHSLPFDLFYLFLHHRFHQLYSFSHNHFCCLYDKSYSKHVFSSLMKLHIILKFCNNKF